MWLMSSHKSNHSCLEELLFITFQRRDDQKKEERKYVYTNTNAHLQEAFS